MSSFKGDSYFNAHVDDDAFDPDYRESSDEESAESDKPLSIKRERAQWIVDNQVALEELMHCFQRDGYQLFGRAFFQLGDVNQFAKFVFRTTVPGGNN